MTAAVFWACVAVLVYVYAGYPALMWFLARRKPAPPAPSLHEWPTASLIVSAFNEERVLREKLVNSLALNYPRDKLEIIVASDGSTDRTDAIAAEFRAQGVRLIRLGGHQGKTAVQNVAAAQATGEILVFSDANALYAPDALQRLIRHFSREEVGCVEGRRADFSPGDSATARHELTYRDMESRIKLWESRVFSCTGATGPIYAVRRALYVPLHPAMISDLMEPILIVCRHGKRHVFEPDALSREAVLPDMGHEFRRKVRIMTRCLNSLRGAPEALSPFRAGWFSLQLFSHRVLRWLAPVVAVAAFVANVFLLPHPLYRAAFLLQISFLLVAAAGAALDRLAIGPALLRLPHYFFMSNLAALTALGNCLIGRQVIVWRPLRETETAGSARP